MKLMLEMQSDKEGDKLHSHMYSLTWNKKVWIYLSIYFHVALYSFTQLSEYIRYNLKEEN